MATGVPISTNLLWLGEVTGVFGVEGEVASSVDSFRSFLLSPAQHAPALCGVEDEVASSVDSFRSFLLSPGQHAPSTAVLHSENIKSLL